jgi:hypothetical protein
MRTGRQGLRAIAAVALALAARDADAVDETHACVIAADEGQALRDKQDLVAARARFVSCSRDVCPGPVRIACAQWRAEVDARQPTVVFAARDAGGRDLVRVRISIDGVVVLESLNGAGVPVNPGPRSIRFEADGTVVEETIVVREGEKDRVVGATFSPRRAAPVPAVVAASTQSPRAEEPFQTSAVPAPVAPDTSTGWHVPLAAWGLGGVGVLAAGGFAYFGLKGQGDKNALAGCAPPAGGCDSKAVDNARNELIAADVFLVASVVSLAAAVYLTLTSYRAPRATRHASTVSLGMPTGGSNIASLGAWF